MSKGPRTALIAEGAVSQSWIVNLPGLRRSLGPVMGLSLRNASRIVNLIRCGVATNCCEHIHNSELVFIAVPDDQLAKWVDRILQHGEKLKKLAFVCCSSRADSGALHRLAEHGSQTGSLSEMEGFEGKRYLFEGDNVILHRLRRLIEADGAARIIQMDKRKRRVYEAGLTFANGMTFPMISAAVETMRAAGIHVKVAESAVENAVIGALRAYLRAGKRGWTGPIAKADREELRRQYTAVFEVDPVLAEMYLKIAVDYLVEKAPKPK
jgi:predicted short-subunit dehydrogenase-like oxidoreductase (DUF2520 family)